MSLFSGIVQSIIGGLEIAAGIALEAGATILTGGLGTVGVGQIAIPLIISGSGMVLSGIGSMLAGNGAVNGFATTERHPTAPWNVIYGRARVGGTLVYLHTWPTNPGKDWSNKVMDMVIVLAAHPIHSVEALLIDNQKIQLSTIKWPFYFGSGTGAGSGVSFTPVQQTTNITSIQRNEFGIVTVTTDADIPLLSVGDRIEVRDITVGDPTLNGIFQVNSIVSRVAGVPHGSPGTVTFTVLNGGIVVGPVTNNGHCRTEWQDYQDSIYCETMLGTQTPGHTFKGMQPVGSVYGDNGFMSPQLPPQTFGPSADPVNAFGGEINPWNTNCSLLGKSAVFLRFVYDPNIYKNGIPQVSFLVKGKSDIYDPRTGTYGYTENAALCIADFLNQGDPTDGRNREGWGFKAPYGTEIDTDQLTAAANACDEAVPVVVGGTEPRYACNGQFTLDQKRGEILQNMLTSCAGRLVYTEGKYKIFPGVWSAPLTPAVDVQAIATGPFKWRPTVSIRELYNGCKGTYINASASWIASDFPAYAQDSEHGYDGPPEFAGDINLEADGGDRRWLDIQLPFTISASTAQRIAKIELLRRRHYGTGTFQCNMSAYQYTPLDVIEANSAYLGWTTKQLEVSAVRLTATKQQVTEGQEAYLLGTELDLQETDSAIYEWSTEEELAPTGFQQVRIPKNTVIEDVPYQWSPGYAAPIAGDTYYGTIPASFGIQPVYGATTDGKATAALQVKGTPPPNALSEVGSPQTTSIASTTGGNLKGGTYVVALAARDSGDLTHYGMTRYLDIQTCVIDAGTTTGSITTTILWGSGNDGGDLYMGYWNNDGLVFHHQQYVAPDTASVTITDFDQTTAGGPDPLFHHFSATWQQIIHGGPFAAQVQGVTTDTVTLAVPVGSGYGTISTNQWVGYTISLLAKYNPAVDVPILNMPIASNTASDPTSGLWSFTIGTNALGQTLPDLTTLLTLGDLLVMRLNATFTGTSFTDPNIANGYFPTGASGVEAGHVAVVLTGPDAGDIQTIASVTNDGSGNPTVFNLAGSWTTTPNTGDLVIVCVPPTTSEVTGTPLKVKNNLVNGVMLQPDVLNLAQRVWLFRVRTEDKNNNYGADALAPYREIFFFGSQGTRSINLTDQASNPTPYSGPMRPTDKTLEFDTSTDANLGSAPTTDTVAADIDNQQTTIQLRTGTGILNGIYVKIDDEIMYVVSGEGTAVLLVERGAQGTTAAAHTASTTVHIPGALIFTLCPITQIVNQDVTLHKVTEDLNFVKVLPGSTDELPNGASYIILSDISPDRGTLTLKAPGV